MESKQEFHKRTGHSCDELDILKIELENENKNRNHSQLKYSDLNRQIDLFHEAIEEAKKQPESKYDSFVSKQSFVNETMLAQLTEAKDKLAHLSQSLKTIAVCGKDCNLNMKDLYVDYNCISKSDLTKEVKRFERMNIDIKSNLDRLQWRLDCEAKLYYNLLDQFQKLQIEMYYLQNLIDKHY